ncbi:MAG: hypothetical protein LBP59_07385 [Planctomycetaceae bacterium]|jgi:hypothetical protein|nr:hypothetical protein [Planctomycetaceae bacterium]
MKNYYHNTPTKTKKTNSKNNTLPTRPKSNASKDKMIDGQIYKGDNSMSQDVNVLALVKGEERYIFLYSDASRAETLRTLGRYASNPDLSFTWYDAAVLSQKIRQESQQILREQQQQQQPNDFYNQTRYNNIYSETVEELD